LHDGEAYHWARDCPRPAARIASADEKWRAKMSLNDQDRIRIAREYFVRADEGLQTYLNFSMKLLKFISLSLDLDFAGSLFSRWLKDSQDPWNTLGTIMTP
jgi:hypothetical protein